MRSACSGGKTLLRYLAQLAGGIVGPLLHWRSAMESCTTDGRVAPHYSNLSLVLARSAQGRLEPEYVSWRTPAELCGQQVIVRDGQVVFSMTVGPYAKPFQDYRRP